MWRSARRNPVGSGIVVALVLLPFGVWQIDALRSPWAWSAREFLPTHLAGPLKDMPYYLYYVMGSMHDYDHHDQVGLSADGKWMWVRILHDHADETNHLRGAVRLYQLTARPHGVEVATSSERISIAAFSCDSRWFAYQVRAQDRTLEDVRIVDLATLEDKSINSDYRYLSEQPGLFNNGKLLLEGGSQGCFIELTNGTWTFGAPSWNKWDTNVPAKEFDRHQFRAPCSLSPNERFLISEGRLYARDAEDVQESADNESENTLCFHAFSRRNHAIGAEQLGQRSVFRKYFGGVPLLERICDWAERPAVCIIDPQTGDELARTYPLKNQPHDIAISSDGSRMAVINLEGVYIYDVPAEFR
jgi:hypothetical protein